MATAKRRKVLSYWDDETLGSERQRQKFVEWPAKGIDITFLFGQIEDIDAPGRNGYHYSHVFVSPSHEGVVRELFRVKIHKYDNLSVMIGVSAKPEDSDAQAKFEDKLRSYLAKSEMVTAKYTCF